jgi:hypothetical protein
MAFVVLREVVRMMMVGVVVVEILICLLVFWAHAILALSLLLLRGGILGCRYVVDGTMEVLNALGLVSTEAWRAVEPARTAEVLPVVGRFLLPIGR